VSTSKESLGIRIPTNASVWTAAGRASSKASVGSGRDGILAIMRESVSDVMEVADIRADVVSIAVVLVTGTSITGIETIGETCIKEAWNEDFLDCFLVEIDGNTRMSMLIQDVP
jgi:hypothetical protein